MTTKEVKQQAASPTYLHIFFCLLEVLIAENTMKFLNIKYNLRNGISFVPIIVSLLYYLYLGY